MKNILRAKQYKKGDKVEENMSINLTKENELYKSKVKPIEELPDYSVFTNLQPEIIKKINEVIRRLNKEG